MSADILHRFSRIDLVPARFCDKSLFLLIITGKSALIQKKLQFPGLPRLQLHFFKCSQLSCRTFHGTVLFPHIDLHRLLSCTASRIGHGQGKPHITGSVCGFRLRMQIVDGKLCIGKSMAKREKHRNSACIVMTVADKNSLFITYFLSARKFADAVRGTVSAVHRKCLRQTAGRIYLAEQRFRQRGSALHSGIILPDQSLHLIRPRHFHRRTGDHHNDHIGIDPQQFEDQLVLSIRKFHILPVHAFQILIMILSADQQYGIVIRRFFHCLPAQRFLTQANLLFLFQRIVFLIAVHRISIFRRIPIILLFFFFRRHTVLRLAFILRWFQTVCLPVDLRRLFLQIVRIISLHIIHLYISAEKFFDPQQRCDLIQRLDLGASSSIGVDPVGVVSDDEDLLCLFPVQRKHLFLVFQQDHRLPRRIKNGFLMFKGVVSARFAVFWIHFSNPEHQSEDIADLPVDPLLRNFSVLHRPDQRICHTVFIKVIGHGHLNIQPARRRLFCIVDSARSSTSTSTQRRSVS